MQTNSPSPLTHVVCTEFNNGDGVLVDLSTKRYYQLNETATLVWRALEQGKARTAIIDEMTNTYDVTQNHAEESLDRLITEFQSRKLVGVE